MTAGSPASVKPKLALDEDLCVDLSGHFANRRHTPAVLGILDLTDELRLALV
jgi:hypothetical protein